MNGCVTAVCNDSQDEECVRPSIHQSESLHISRGHPVEQDVELMSFFPVHTLVHARQAPYVGRTLAQKLLFFSSVAISPSELRQYVRADTRVVVVSCVGESPIAYATHISMSICVHSICIGKLIPKTD